MEGVAHQRAVARGSKLVACSAVGVASGSGEARARGSQVRRKKPEHVSGQVRSYRQTATRAPHETLCAPTSARPRSVRVLLLVRTLQENLSARPVPDIYLSYQLLSFFSSSISSFFDSLGLVRRSEFTDFAPNPVEQSP